MTAENKWYALRVISGQERKLRDYIENDVKRSKWDSVIKQILVPTEKVYKIQNGKKVIKERNFLPGYILVEAIDGGMSAEMISSIAGVTGVIHFLGKEHPTPLRASEVNRILGTADEMEETGETANEPFIVDEMVRIIDGPFNDFKGTIEEVNEEKKKLKVVVKIFGRRQPVELSFMQVEKLS
jgi:transcriptional antiterminator NusG